VIIHFILFECKVLPKSEMSRGKDRCERAVFVNAESWLGSVRPHGSLLVEFKSVCTSDLTGYTVAASTGRPAEDIQWRKSPGHTQSSSSPGITKETRGACRR